MENNKLGDEFWLAIITVVMSFIAGWFGYLIWDLITAVFSFFACMFILIIIVYILGDEDKD